VAEARARIGDATRLARGMKRNCVDTCLGHPHSAVAPWGGKAKGKHRCATQKAPQVVAGSKHTGRWPAGQKRCLAKGKAAKPTKQQHCAVQANRTSRRTGELGG